MKSFEQMKQLVKQTILYGLGGALQKLIGFFLFPIYAHLLSVSDFGASDLVLTTIFVISSVLALGMDSAAARHFYDADTAKHKKMILSTWLWVQMLFSSCICLLLLAMADQICQLIFQDNSLTYLFQLGVIGIPFGLLSGITMMAMRLSFEPKKFSVIATINVIIQAVAGIWLVGVMGLGIRGVFIGLLISNIVGAGLGLLMTYKHFGLVFSTQKLKALLYFGLPLVPASLSIWIFNYSNRYFLVHYGSLVDVGFLAVATRLSSILALGLMAFQTAWGPFAYSLIKDEELAKSTYSKTLTYLLLMSFFCTVGLSVFAREAILVLATPAYESAAVLVPWLCYGAIAWGGLYIVGMGYGIAKQSYHLTIATVLAAGLTLGFNFLLIPKWGTIGAVLGTMVGNCIALMYAYYVGQHYYYVRYDLGKIFVLAAMTTFTVLISLVIDQITQPWSSVILLYKFLLVGGYGIGLYFLKLISPDELDEMRGYFSAKLQFLRLGNARV
jgi:O-antigen/teichoic acid export membrane protein